MLKRIQILTILLTLSVLFFTSNLATAASIKDRMASRIPAITTLKDQGVVGENSGGYLAFRTGNRTSQDVVNAENSDRKKVYTKIAQDKGVSVDLVGQRRAKMIADKGKSGHWFQRQDGSWYKK